VFIDFDPLEEVFDFMPLTMKASVIPSWSTTPRSRRDGGQTALRQQLLAQGISIKAFVA